MIDRRPFWTDESERLTYEHAVETNPRRPNEGPGAYIARLAAIASGRIVPRWPGAKPIPRGREVAGEVQRMTKAQIDQRVAELEGQRGPQGAADAH